MAIKKLQLPDNSSQDIHDARITGVDSTPTASSTNVVTSGGVATAISNVEHFYFVQGSSSAAGSSTSGAYLSTKWEGVVSGITTPTNGLKIAYRVATNPGVASGGAVLSINGTTGPYYPVVIQKNTMVTTHYPVGATFLAVFNSTQTATAYLTAGTKSTVTGCWQIMEYDSNTNTYQREYVSSGNVEYPITTRYNTTSGESYYAEYGRYSEGVTLNPSTNTITASKFKVTSGTSSQFLKADGSTDSNTYALASAIPSAPGTLDTTATTAQTTSASEALSGSITLHKVAKTGTFSDLVSKPTTLSGYGITDAKIQSGTITLGSNTITPLTSHQDISDRVQLGDVVESNVTIIT